MARGSVRGFEVNIGLDDFSSPGVKFITGLNSEDLPASNRKIDFETKNMFEVLFLHSRLPLKTMLRRCLV